jgi:hypothetical protein
MAALAVAALVLVLATSAFGATIRGTPRADTLVGQSGSDRIYGYGGADVLKGKGGDDLIVGGAGADTLFGGRGNDRIRARDGFRDVVHCGSGRGDLVIADEIDVGDGCETVRFGSVSPPPVDHGSVVLVDQTWTCTGPVDLDLVKVTMRSVDGDAVHLREECSGRIGRLEIDTWTLDGVKVNAPAPAAHDLVVEGGYIRCHAQTRGHQDGVQALGGERITFRDLEINCNSGPNAQFFVAGSLGGVPTDVVCDHCLLGTGAASTLRVHLSVRSGARDSLICPGRFFDRVIGPEAVDPVDSGNRILAASDSRCRGV